MEATKKMPTDFTIRPSDIFTKRPEMTIFITDEVMCTFIE